MHEKLAYVILHKRPLTNQIYMKKLAECICDPLHENNLIAEHLHNREDTLHMEYVNCPTFLTTFLQRESV